MDGLLTIQAIPIDKFMESLSDLIAARVEEVIKKVKSEELQEKFLSPREVTKLFNPSISLVTLSAWTKAGRLKKYHVSGRCYYKYSEVLEAITGSALKKYNRA